MYNDDKKNRTTSRHSLFLFLELNMTGNFQASSKEKKKLEKFENIYLSN